MPAQHDLLIPRVWASIRRFPTYNQRAMIYCVIPRELADELYDKMVDYYKDNPNVTVIVDRRDGTRPSQAVGGAARGQGAADGARPPPRPSGHLPGRRRAARVARPLVSPHGDDDERHLQELHRRRVGGRRLRRDLREHEPGERRDDRRLPALGRRGRRPRGRGREGGVRGVAARAGAEARRDPLPPRAAARAGEVGAHRPDDARDGEGEGRGGRRRPGGDRHHLLHGRRGQAPLRPDDAVGAAEQVEHEHPRCRSASSARSRRGTSRSRFRPGSSSRRSICGNTVVLKPADGHARARRALRRRCSPKPASPTASSTSSTATAERVGERARPSPRRSA